MPGWLSPVKCPTPGFGLGPNLRVARSSPKLGSTLTVEWSPLKDSLPLPLPIILSPK